MPFEKRPPGRPPKAKPSGDRNLPWLGDLSAKQRLTILEQARRTKAAIPQHGSHLTKPENGSQPFFDKNGNRLLVWINDEEKPGSDKARMRDYRDLGYEEVTSEIAGKDELCSDEYQRVLRISPERYAANQKKQIGKHNSYMTQTEVLRSGKVAVTSTKERSDGVIDPTTFLPSEEEQLAELEEQEQYVGMDD